MQDDVGVPEAVRQSVPPKGSSSDCLARSRKGDEELTSSLACTGEFTDWQVKRAVKLVERLVDFKLKLDR